MVVAGSGSCGSAMEQTPAHPVTSANPDGK